MDDVKDEIESTKLKTRVLWALWNGGNPASYPSKSRWVLTVFCFLGQNSWDIAAWGEVIVWKQRAGKRMTGLLAEEPYCVSLESGSEQQWVPTFLKIFEVTKHQLKNCDSQGSKPR